MSLKIAHDKCLQTYLKISKYFVYVNNIFSFISNNMEIGILNNFGEIYEGWIASEKFNGEGIYSNTNWNK